MIYQPSIVVHGKEAAEAAVDKMREAGVDSAQIDPASDSSSGLFGVVTHDEDTGGRVFAEKVQKGEVEIDALSCPDCGGAWVLYPMRPQSSPSAEALDTIVRNVANVMSGNNGHEFPAQCRACGKEWFPDAS